MEGRYVTDLKRFFLISAVLFLTAVLILGTGTGFVLRSALEKEAQSRGMDWAHFLESELSKHEGQAAAGNVDAHSHTLNSPEFRQVLTSVFSLGHIFQIDYVSAVCHCEISVTASEVLTFGTPTDEGHNHGTVDSPTAQNSAFSTDTKYRIDTNLVQDIATQHLHRIILQHASSPDLPRAFAEVYHPVQLDGQASYTLRILVNLDEIADQYFNLLLGGIAISLFLIGAIIGYPTYHFLRSQNSQREVNEQAMFLANHDVLTGLHNRNNFQQTIDEMLKLGYENNQSVFLFIFDLNGFKNVNDYYGHDIGDKLLCEFAGLLSDLIPKNGYVARLGGDEFIILIGGIDQDDIDISAVLNLPETLEMRLPKQNQPIKVGISGGVSRYPHDAQTAAELLQAADLALYAAKTGPTGTIVEFTPQMFEGFNHRLTLKDSFRDALTTGQIVPYYQPIMNVQSGVIEGFEALARWNHPEKGVLTPYYFHDIFKDVDLAAALGRFMLEAISVDMALWMDQGVHFGKVALNIVDGDLLDPDFSDRVLQTLKKRNLPTSSFTIEVTENCMFGANRDAFIEQIQVLRNAGCGIALDDFGTGFSSITQLKDLPITTVKVDKSFVDLIETNIDDQCIIKALSGIGVVMDFDLVLEGVETADQLAYLRDNGYTAVQGYYYSKPMPALQLPLYVSLRNKSLDEEPFQDAHSNATQHLEGVQTGIAKLRA